MRNRLLFIVWISEGGCKALGVDYGQMPDLNNIGIQQTLGADREAACASQSTGLQIEPKPMGIQKKKKPGKVEVAVEHGRTGGEVRDCDGGAVPSARKDEEKNDEKGKRRTGEWITPVNKQNKEKKRDWAEVDANLWIAQQKRRLL